MNLILILAIVCLMGSVLSAQNCYDNLLNKGMKEYKAGNYDKALIKWKAALEDCPELTSTQRSNLNDWIAKAQNPNVTTPSVSSSSTQQSYEPEMVFVQGGTFNMGSNDGSSDEKPIHSVTVSSFYIGKYEITQKQWREVMGISLSTFKNCEECPVESVSWDDAQQFLQKLYAKTGKKYRLPTEAEWEYAARGGSNSNGYKYSGSNNIDNVAWYGTNSGSKPHTVGTKQANELGIFDIAGNVWEWCSDWFNKDYYQNSPSRNPTGASSGDFRVIRGCSWGSYDFDCRVAIRRINYPSSRYRDIGFRVVRDE